MYVGETCNFESAYLLQISADISNSVIIDETAVYGNPPNSNPSNGLFIILFVFRFGGQKYRATCRRLLPTL
jgi:hypothetical protein